VIHLVSKRLVLFSFVSSHPNTPGEPHVDNFP
jgi:hypothetical protein